MAKKNTKKQQPTNAEAAEGLGIFTGGGLALFSTWLFYIFYPQLSDWLVKDSPSRGPILVLLGLFTIVISSVIFGGIVAFLFENQFNKADIKAKKPIDETQPIETTYIRPSGFKPVLIKILGYVIVFILSYIFFRVMN